jgi:uncharacterized protein YndB with AHSA1/START domain
MAVKNANSEAIVTRIFAAPVETIWTAWTKAELLKQWLAPANYTVPYYRNEFRVGGKTLNCMRSPDGKDIWGTGIYKEIIPNKKIVTTDSFADKDGNVVPASDYGMGDDFPMEMLVTVLFEEIDGNTKVTLIHSGLPDGEMKEMTGQGWSECLDKLEKLVVTINSNN